MINLPKIRSFLKKITIENLSFNKNFYSQTNSSLRIIMFHDTPKKDHNIYINQIKFFIANGWKFLDPKKFIKKKISKKKFQGKNIVITFDDGLKSNKDFAYKLQKQFGIKSIFFVPVSFIKMKKVKDIKRFCTEKLQITKKSYNKLNLNLKDLNKLINEGHIVGSHTINHPNLKKINNLKELNSEIQGSKKILKKLLKKDVNTFAFTFGALKDISQISMDLSLKSYDLVFSGIRGNNMKNNKILFRDEINSSYSNKMCLSFLDGNADLYYKISRQKLLNMGKRNI
jgi:peptidoglycan/xylan/chitin deacetylase (PgdA/CDA1 family)